MLVLADGSKSRDVPTMGPTQPRRALRSMNSARSQEAVPTHMGAARAATIASGATSHKKAGDVPRRRFAILAASSTRQRIPGR